MSELETLRANAEEQNRLIDVQRQKAKEADREVENYLEQQAQRMISQGMQEYGDIFFEAVGWVVSSTNPDIVQILKGQFNPE